MGTHSKHRSRTNVFIGEDNHNHKMLSKKFFLLLSFLLLGGQTSIGNAFKLNWNRPQNPEEHGDHFEGDIILPALSGRSGTLYAARWPGGRIPYSFEPNYPQSLGETAKAAMRHIESSTSGCIKFVERTNEVDFIFITFTTTGCNSYVGRQGGLQNVSLPSYCWSFRTHVHEFIHAVGFYHEHSRTDRDDFVRVQLDNVMSGFEFNFDKYDENEVSDFGVSYDYDSVMHYSRTAFTSNGKDTIVPVDPLAVIGEAPEMSPKDAEKVRRMYECQT